MKAIKQLFILMVIIFAATKLFAQENSLPTIDIKHEKFNVIKEKLENYIKYSEQNNDAVDVDAVGENESDEPFLQTKRWLEEMSTHLDENGFVTNYAAKNWEEYLKLKKSNNTRIDGTLASTGGYWFSKAPLSEVSTGDRNGNGRVNCLALDPVNSNTFYAGANEGGLWKTTDGGVNWTCITNGVPVMAISGIAINPSNTNNIYILTGRAGNNNFYAGSPSIGVLVTYDGGNNWLTTALVFDQSNNISGADLIMSPVDNNTLLAATDHGIYQTQDGGLTWPQTNITNAVYDLEFKPGTSTCYAGGVNDIYISNSGGSFTTVSSYSPSKPMGSSIVELAVSPANANYVYALFQGGCGNDDNSCLSSCPHSKVLLSTNSGSPSFIEQSDVTTSPLCMSYQGGYGYGLAVSSSNAGTLYMGDINIFKSTSSGVMWTQVASGFFTPNVHEDTHDIICRGSSEVFIANDGGVYKSNDAGVSYNFLSARLNCPNYFGFGGYPGDPNLFIGGTQDNGNLVLAGSALTHLDCCDEGDAMFKANDANITYQVGLNTSHGLLFRSLTGGTNATDITAPRHPNCLCPDTNVNVSNRAFGQNPLNPNTIYSIYFDFYVSFNGGTTWQPRKITTSASPFYCYVQGTNDTTWFYALNSNNEIWASSNNGVSWKNILSLGASPKPWDILVNPNDKNEFYFSYADYDATNKVKKSTWDGNMMHDATMPDNISSGLPNVPMFRLAYQNTATPGIYVGSDIGVFFRSNATGNWELFSDGLPYCRVIDLEINYPNNLISCATYGRGIWQSPLYDHGSQ